MRAVYMRAMRKGLDVKFSQVTGIEQRELKQNKLLCLVGKQGRCTLSIPGFSHCRV